MKVNRLIFLLAAMALVLTVSIPAQAVCSVSFGITTINANGGYSYVYTPGIPAPDAPAISPNFKAIYWMFQAGDPALGVGNDNGGQEAGAFAENGGMMFNYTYPGGGGGSYGAYINGDWAGNAGIDGCPNLTPSTCMMMVLTDEDPAGVGYAAILSTTQEPTGYNFNQPGDAPINLAPIGRPNITGSTRLDANNITIDIAAPALDGLYLNGCGDPIAGYRVLQQSVPQGAQPPSSRDLANWDVVSAPTVDIAADTTVAVNCGSDVDVYLTTSVVFDSGFETLQVSQNSSRIECGPNVAEPQQRPRLRPGQPVDLRGRGGKSGR